MKLAFVILWLLTVLALFRQFPADEASVRSAVMAIVYVFAYIALALVIRLVRRLLKIGR